MKISLLAVVVLAIAAPRAADAQQMTLQMQHGLVTLDAQDVPVRQILAEWARVGGAKVVNGEKVTGAPVTLQLRGVPERQALDSILRGVSGYMLAARVDDSTGPSAFDRILILPASSAPRNPPPAAIGGFTGRPIPAMPEEAEPVEGIVEDGDNDAPDDEDAHEEPPQPEQRRNQVFQRRPNMFPNPMGGQPQPFVTGVPQAEDAEQEAPEPTPGNPFGLPAGSSTTPGAVSPVPQPENRPTTSPRPPRPPR